MFNSVTRVIRVDDMSWLQTVNNIVYRNLSNGLIINRSSELYLGRVVLGKFYVMAKGNDGRYVKMRNRNGDITYFSDALAAMEASTQLNEVFKLEEERKLLVGILNELSLEIEAKRKELDAVKPADMSVLVSPTETGIVEEAVIVTEPEPVVVDEPTMVVEDTPTPTDTKVDSDADKFSPEELKALGELPAFMHEGAKSILRTYH